MKIKTLGLKPAFLVSLYCMLVVALIWNADKVFDDEPTFLAPLSFLLLFIVSALISAGIVFFKPYQLFLANKKQQAVELVLWTTGWLVVLFILFFLTAVSLNLN